MKLSTQIENYVQRFGYERAVEMVIQSGYDAIDCSCFTMLEDTSPLMQPDYLELAERLRSLADFYGVYFNQAHAPFPSSTSDEEFTRDVFTRIVRSMEFCSVLGVRNIVVHPKQHKRYSEYAEEMIKESVDFYRSLIPYCEKYNIKVAVENMWQRDDEGHCVPSVCGTAEDFKAMMEELNHPCFVACLDIGHAQLVGEDIPDMIRTLGPWLKALHVHDVEPDQDLHVIPYLGKIEVWDEILMALHEIGYDGELTFEADNTLIHMPDSLQQITGKFMHDVGRNMIRRMELLTK